MTETSLCLLFFVENFLKITPSYVGLSPPIFPKYYFKFLENRWSRFKIYTNIDLDIYTYKKSLFKDIK